MKRGEGVGEGTRPEVERGGESEGKRVGGKGPKSTLEKCSDFVRGFEKGLAGGGWRPTAPKMQQKLSPELCSCTSEGA